MSAKKLFKPSRKTSDSKRHERGMNDIEWDRLMKTVEEIKTEADKKLEEISDICLNRECSVKQR